MGAETLISSCICRVVENPVILAACKAQDGLQETPELPKSQVHKPVIEPAKVMSDYIYSQLAAKRHQKS